MPKDYLNVNDLMSQGFSKWKSEQAIKTANKRIKESGGVIGDRSSAPRKILESILFCDLSNEDKGGSTHDE